MNEMNERMELMRVESGASARHGGNAKSRRRGGMRKIEDIETLKAFIADYKRLKKIAKTLHRYYELACVYTLTERQMKRKEKLECEAKDIATKWGLHIDICTDPRGATICLHDDEKQLKYWRYSGLVIR